MPPDETILVHVQMLSERFMNREVNVTEHALNASWSQHGATTLDPSPLTLHSATCRDANGSCWLAEEEAAPLAMSRAEVTWLAALLVAVFLCSVVANALVCVVFSQRGAQGLSMSNRFLANLTVCNGLFTLLVMPVALTSLLSGRWLLGEALCQAVGLAVNCLVTASTFTLAVVALDRYCAVVTPLHYALRVTRRRCALTIAAVWALALAVAFPPLLGWNSFRFQADKLICTVAWDSAATADRQYTLFLVGVSFLLPLAAMVWTYACIFRAARGNSERTRRSSGVSSSVLPEGDPGQGTPVHKRKRRSSSVPILRRLSQGSCRGSNGSGGGGVVANLLARREEWKTVVTSFLILSSFMLCWLPYFLVILLRALAPSLPLHPVLSTFSTAAALSACAFNPLVYVFRSKASRQDLRLILRRRSPSRGQVASAEPPRGSGEGVLGGQGGERKGEGEKGNRVGLEEEEEEEEGLWGGESDCLRDVKDVTYRDPGSTAQCLTLPPFRTSSLPSPCPQQG